MISSIGYAMGHFARWMTPGSTVVLPASSSSPRVRASAYFDRKLNRTAVLLLNNEEQPHDVAIELVGGAFKGRMGGEQSTESAYWQGVRPVAPAAPQSVRITVPAYSVTTLVDGMRSTAPPRAPVVRAGAAQQLPTGSTTATLTGTARDPDGKLRWHSWVLESGPAPARIERRADLKTTVTGLQPGEYVFRLHACDNDWRLGSSTVRVSVGK